MATAATPLPRCPFVMQVMAVRDQRAWGARRHWCGSPCRSLAWGLPNSTASNTHTRAATHGGVTSSPVSSVRSACRTQVIGLLSLL